MNRTLSPLQSIDRGQVNINCSFSPNGTSQPVATSNKGQGFTVSRTGVGTFQVTLTEPVADVIAAQPALSLGTPGNAYAQVNGWTKNASNRYVFIVSLLVAGTVADVAAAAGNVVSLDLTVQHSGSKPY